MSNDSQAQIRHAYMVDDELRTKPLITAIEQTVKPGMVVIDIGTGTGILAITAAKAGAKSVYAIECEFEALETAKKNAAKADVLDKIKFIHGLSFDVELPEKADLIICETIGSFAFDENILAMLFDAKSRMLRENGTIIPQRLEMWGAPLSTRPEVEEPAEIAVVSDGDLMAKPIAIKSIEFDGEIPEGIHTKAQFKTTGDGIIRAFAIWPKVTWSKGLITDASPLAETTHWQQGILEIEPKQVHAKDEVEIEIIIEPHPDDPVTMTERLWRWSDNTST
jgi:predicted RNA methylase